MSALPVSVVFVFTVRVRARGLRVRVRSDNRGSLPTIQVNTRSSLRLAAAGSDRLFFPKGSLAERALARGLTTELGIEHQSPQALWFAHGELVWHDSHGAITALALAANRQN